MFYLLGSRIVEYYFKVQLISHLIGINHKREIYILLWVLNPLFVTEQFSDESSTESNSS